MRISAYLLAALLLGTAALVALHSVFAAGESRTSSSASPRPDLEYLKASTAWRHRKIRSCCFS